MRALANPIQDFITDDASETVVDSCSTLVIYRRLLEDLGSLRPEWVLGKSASRVLLAAGCLTIRHYAAVSDRRSVA